MIKAVEIIIGVVVAYFLIGGVRKGLVRQVLEVVGIIAAFLCAFYLAHNLAVYMQPKIDLSYNLLLVISAAAIFAAVIIGFHYLGLAMRKFLSITLLGSFDRVMGGVFGAIKGLMLCSLLLIILLALPLPGDFRKELRDDPVVSRVRPVLPVLYDTFFSASDVDFDDIIDSAGDELRKKAGEKSEMIRNESERLKEKVKSKVEE